MIDTLTLKTASSEQPIPLPAGPREVLVQAEGDYTIRLYEDESGSTWIAFREAEEWTEPRPVNELIRDMYIGL